MRFALDDDDVQRIADALAPRLAEIVVARISDSRARDDEWLTTAEAASHLGISRSTLHKMTAAREIPFSQEKIGSRCYFRRSDLDEWRGR